MRHLFKVESKITKIKYTFEDYFPVVGRVDASVKVIRVGLTNEEYLLQGHGRVVVGILFKVK